GIASLRGAVPICGASSLEVSYWAVSTQREKFATTGLSRRFRKGTKTLHFACTLATTCPASNELPPRSKKLSCTPTPRTPSTSSQILVTKVSVGVCGGT